MSSSSRRRRTSSRSKPRSRDSSGCSPRSDAVCPDPDAGHARHERPHAPRHRCRERADDARGTARRRRRPQLLDGARAHAGARPVSHRARDAAHLRDPERRTAAQHRDRRRGLSARARAAGEPRCRRVRPRFRRAHRRRLLRHHARAPPAVVRGDPAARGRRIGRAAATDGAPPRVAACLERDARHHAPPGPAAAPRGRARQRAGLARGQADSCSRTTTTASCASRATRPNRARTCSTCVSR